MYESTADTFDMFFAGKYQVLGVHAQLSQESEKFSSDKKR